MPFPGGAPTLPASALPPQPIPGAAPASRGLWSLSAAEAAEEGLSQPAILPRGDALAAEDGASALQGPSCPDLSAGSALSLSDGRSRWWSFHGKPADLFLSCKQGSSQHHFFRKTERTYFFNARVYFKDCG